MKKHPSHSAMFGWNESEYRQFGEVAQICSHNYHTLPIFQTEALIELLDQYPRKHLQCYTMGLDPECNEDWKQVDIHERSRGEDLWAAVNHGRLWLNLVHLEENSEMFASLISGMYEELAVRCKHLHDPKATHSALLISSPSAQVYYHLDAEPNMLWHIKGTKDVWLYPAMDPELVPQSYLEDIYAGEIGENLPYHSSFDQRALHHTMQEGEVASWPHNAPHRVVNHDLNVSLATSYYTKAIYKRQYVQLANRFLLRNLGIKKRSMQEHGVIPASKRMAYRAINRIKPFKRRVRSQSYITDLQLDPGASLGFRVMPEAKLASFAKGQ